MKISYRDIADVFYHSLNISSTPFKAETEISRLIFLCIEINKQLWELEDVSRMHLLGFENVAKAKMQIDSANQRRNEIINQLDVLLEKHLGNIQSKSLEKFYAESPAMLIDRIAILYIRLQFIEKLIALIGDKDLRKEYLEKRKYITRNINDLGVFLDSYFNKIEKGEAYFKVYKPLKIYNDERVKQYIQNLSHNKNEK